MHREVRQDIFVRIAVVLSLVIAGLITVLIPVYSVKNYAEKQAQATLALKRSLPIYSVATEEKKIAISFDCAWGVEYTDKLLDIMQKNGVRCTFFAVQFWWRNTPNTHKKS